MNFMPRVLIARILIALGLASTPVYAEPRSDLWAPAVSVLLPGFDQWMHQDYGAAAAYSGIWLGGGLVASSAKKAIEARVDAEGDGVNVKIDTRDDTERRYLLGGQLSFAAGSYSALHAFRSAADSRREDGQYEFLRDKVTVQDTVLAPFDFSYLARPTTYIPLGLMGAVAVASARSDAEGYQKVGLRGSDYAFGGAFSHLAGTHEEALFRGWMMPLFREYVAGDVMSNASQSLLFALAHLGSNSIPIPQLLLGYHLGYVTQRNGWSLGEAAFIHTWWDVFNFLALYSRREVDLNASQRAGRTVLKTPALNLPPISLVF